MVLQLPAQQRRIAGKKEEGLRISAFHRDHCLIAVSLSQPTDFHCHPRATGVAGPVSQLSGNRGDRKKVRRHESIVTALVYRSKSRSNMQKNRETPRETGNERKRASMKDNIPKAFVNRLISQAQDTVSQHFFLLSDFKVSSFQLKYGVLQRFIENISDSDSFSARLQHHFLRLIAVYPHLKILLPAVMEHVTASGLHSKRTPIGTAQESRRNGHPCRS